MEHVFLLKNKELLEDLFDCSECRVGIRSPSLNIASGSEVFELLVSKMLNADHSLVSSPLLTHFKYILGVYPLVLIQALVTYLSSEPELDK